MKQSWFISDLHFGHPNILTYMKKERPFASKELVNKLDERNGVGPDFQDELWETLEIHNQSIVNKINEYVNPTDTLWILGDVAFKSRDALNYVTKINCKNKRLVLGNHDLYSMAEYTAAGFSKIYGMARHKEFVLTHAPIHPQQLSKRYSANIHGHLHCEDVDDHRYYNVNIDRTGGIPVNLQQIRDSIRYENS